MFDFDNLQQQVALVGDPNDQPDPFAALYADAVSAQSQSPQPALQVVPETPNAATPMQQNLVNQLVVQNLDIFQVQQQPPTQVEMHVHVTDNSPGQPMGTMFQQAHGDAVYGHMNPTDVHNAANDLPPPGQAGFPILGQDDFDLLV